MLFLAWRLVPWRLSSSRPELLPPLQALRTKANAGKTTRILMKLIKPGIGGILGPDGHETTENANLKQGYVELQAAGYRTINSCTIVLTKLFYRTTGCYGLAQRPVRTGSQAAQNVTKTPQVRGESCSRA